MADSNITKKALAAALRELMEEIPFDKIRIADICGRCGMNRKSFYYHFKDKYDLVNWIFDTDIITFIQNTSSNPRFYEQMEMFQEVCNYFYENRSFYSKALKIEGQNSFSEHFREWIMPILKIRLAQIIGDSDDDFALNFFTDATVYTIERWLTDEQCMPPEQFVAKIISLTQKGAETVHKEFNPQE